MTSRPDLTVILVSWNVKPLLIDCIPSIYSATQDISMQVILVDNGSEDGTVEWCRETWPRVEVIALPENRGFTGGNNAGLKAATGRHVMLLNTDTVVHGGALDTLVNYLDTHPDVGAVGPRLVNEDGSLQRNCRCFPTLWSEFCQEFMLSAFFPNSKWMARYYMGWWPHDKTQEVDFVIGAALVMRKELVDRIGLLDEEMSFIFYEETDWCLRLKKVGYPLVYVHESEIMHLGGASYKHKSTLFHYHMLNARFNYHRKHGGPLMVPLLWLIHVFSGALFAGGLSVLAWCGIKRVSALKMRQRYLDTLCYLRERLSGTHARP